MTIELLAESSAFVGRELKDYGLDYVQVDAGFNPSPMPPPGCLSMYDGWLSTNERFPGGHESIVDAIRSAGLEPALWLNATIGNDEYAEKSGKFLRKANGELIKEHWIGYVFDCADENCEEITRLYRRLAEHGYTYFKIDSIRHLLYDGLQYAVREGHFGNDEAIRRFRNYMGAIRQGIGEDSYLLSCWGVLTPNVGIVDAMRIATDANASDNSFRMQVAESARWHHTHGILYLNDPDYICLRRDAAPAKTLAALVSLNGYLYMLSDDISAYNETKLDIAKKTLPPVNGAITAETGMLESLSGMNYYQNILKPRAGESPLAHGNLWATHYHHCGRSWATVMLIHTWEGESPKEVEVSMEKLGLDPESEYTAFDFWKQAPLGVVKGSFAIAVPEYLDGTLLALTPVSNEIQLIGSSRHVSMDAISVKGMNRKDNVLEISLKGPKGSCADYWFAIPEGMDVSCSDDVTAARSGRYLNCKVTFTSREKVLVLTGVPEYK